MGFILSQSYIIIPIFGICVFTVTYLWADKLFIYFYNKTMHTKDEIMNMMNKKMLMNIQEKKALALTLVLSFGMGILFFLLLFPHILAGLTLGIAMIFVGWTVPKLVMKSLWEKRLDRVVNDLVDGLTIMSNGIKAGLSVPQSIERVVLNMKGPLKQEFNFLLGRIRIGMSLEDALNEFSDRVPRQNVQMLVMAINILKETGGNLAETFSTMVSTIRERQKIEKKIQAMTVQGLTQGVIITLVPFLLMVVFLIVDPSYIKPLFVRPLGWVALAMMLGLQIIGGVVMKRIVTIKV